MFSYGCKPTVTKCTFTYNWATYGGGANSAMLWNCILYYNSAPNGPNYDTAHSAWLNYCCTTPLAGIPGGTGCISNDPAFVNAAAGDYHLASASKCVNAGTNLSWTPPPTRTSRPSTGTSTRT
jgi:hypothetical protein